MTSLFLLLGFISYLLMVAVIQRDLHRFSIRTIVWDVFIWPWAYVVIVPAYYLIKTYMWVKRQLQSVGEFLFANNM